MCGLHVPVCTYYNTWVCFWWHNRCFPEGFTFTLESGHQSTLEHGVVYVTRHDVLDVLSWIQVCRTACSLTESEDLILLPMACPQRAVRSSKEMPFQTTTDPLPNQSCRMLQAERSPGHLQTLSHVLSVNLVSPMRSTGHHVPISLVFSCKHIYEHSAHLLVYWP